MYFVCFKDRTDIDRDQFEYGAHWNHEFAYGFYTGKCLF